MLAAEVSGLSNTFIYHKVFDTNVLGLLKFVDFINIHKICSKIVFVSSMTIYSPLNEIPIKENSIKTPQPHIYGLSKYIGEEIINFVCYHTDIKSLIIRIPGLFGGDRKSGYIYNAIKAINKNQDFTIYFDNLEYWECADVNDIAEMLIELINEYNWQRDSETFNLSYGKEIKFSEIPYFIKDYLGSESKIYRHGISSLRSFYLDNEKIKAIIDFNYDFNSALIRYINRLI